MSALPGTSELTRLAVRRDRIMLPAWLYVTTAAVASTAFTFKKLYPTPASRHSLIVGGGGNPALRFLYGRLRGDSIGALTAWRYGIWAAIFAALMSVFLVVRHTRGDEEAGRLELIGSAAIGRFAPLTATLLVALSANAVLGLLIGLALSAIGLGASGSVALAAGIMLCGLSFAAIGAVTAQLAPGARGARGIAVGVLGAAFMIRAVGDSGSLSWLSWLSPLGWVQLTRPYAGERWWVLALPCALAMAGALAAFLLASGRDQGAGLFPERFGSPVASRWLNGCLGLAWRLERGSLLWWAFGYVMIFTVSGAAAQGIGSLFGGSRGLRKEFTQLGGQNTIVNAYLSALMLLAGLTAAGYAVSVLLRLRAQETGGLAEPLLATPASRVRWALSQACVAGAGSTVLVLVAGVFTGLGYAARRGPLSDIGTLAAAGLAQLPSAFVFAGVALLLFGTLPDAAVAVAWAVLGVAVFITLFGQALSLSHWVLDISPFTHAPHLPGGAVLVAPFAWLLLVFALSCGVGLIRLRRRDLPS